MFNVFNKLWNPMLRKQGVLVVPIILLCTFLASCTSVPKPPYNPPEPTNYPPDVSAYISSLHPQDTIQRGKKFEIASEITVLTKNNLRSIKEELILFDISGNEITRLSKVPYQSDLEPNVYKTHYEIFLPKGIKKGKYSYKTVLSINGMSEHQNKGGFYAD